MEHNSNCLRGAHSDNGVAAIIHSSNEFCATNKNISEEARSLLEAILENRGEAKDGVCMLDKSILENRSELKDVRFQLHENIRNAQDAGIAKTDKEADIIKDRLYSFERSVDKEFCSVKGLIKDGNQAIINQLAADKLDEKNDKISCLRAELSHKESEYNSRFVNYELASMKSMINSVEQNQKFTNKTVQFGTGNLAGTAQTANQG